MTARSRTLKYLPGHLLRFGIAVVSRDEASEDVVEAVCLFCRHFGREQRADKKRRSSSTVKYFRDSFRPDQYTQHHQLQHPSQWKKYKSCSDDEKRRFFPDNAETVSNVNSNAGSSDTTLLLPKVDERGRCFDLKPSIVEIVAVLAVGLGPVEPTVLTRDRLVYEYMTHHNYEGEVPSNCPRWSPPPNTFESCSVVQKEPPMYRVVLFDSLQMDFLMELAAQGMSAAQISASVKSFRRYAPILLDELENQAVDKPSPDYNEAQTAEFVRLGIAASLSIMARVLEESWAFSLELCTVARHSEFSYLDVRIKFYNRIGGLRSAHFLAVPKYVGKCDVMMFQTLSRVLTALLPDWKEKLLGIATDGDIPFPARLNDVIEHFKGVITGSTLYRTSSCSNQLQRILHTFYASIDRGAFLSTLKTLSECVRKDPVILSELNNDPGCLERLKSEFQVTSTPSSLLAFGQEIEMLVAHSSYLRSRLKEIEVSSDTPIVIPQSWWLMLQVLQWITARANAVFDVLEKQHVAISQQATVMASLAEECITGFHAQIHEKQAHNSDTEYVSVDKRVTLFNANLIAFVTSSSEIARDLTKKGYTATVVAVAGKFAFGAVNMIASLVELSVSLKQQCAVSSNSQTAIVTDIPPVLPHELASLNPDEFAVILEKHRRVSLKHADIKAIREEHELLRITFADNKDLQPALELCKQRSSFNVAWSLMDARFKSLEAFAGGLATVYPSFAEPLSDRNARDLVLCTKDLEEARLLLADFEVESALHAQQFQALTKLQEEIYDREINDRRTRKRQKTNKLFNS